MSMNYFTKWPKAQSVATTATVLVEEFFCHFTLHFDAPKELHSNQGRNFEAEVFTAVCAQLGMKKTCTMPLHPQMVWENLCGISA